MGAGASIGGSAHEAAFRALVCTPDVSQAEALLGAATRRHVAAVKAGAAGEAPTAEESHAPGDAAAAAAPEPEDRCDGLYYGFGPATVRDAVRDLAAVARAMCAGDLEPVRRYIYPAVYDALASNAASWSGPRRRTTSGEFIGVLGYRVLRAETNVLHNVVQIEFDCAFRPLCAGDAGAWGGHTLFVGWFCPFISEVPDVASGIVTGCGPLYNLCDPVPLPAPRSSLSWNEQRLAMALMCIRAIGAGDLDTATALMPEQVVKAHAEAQWSKNAREGGPQPVGFRRASGHWSYEAIGGSTPSDGATNTYTGNLVFLPAAALSGGSGSGSGDTTPPPEATFLHVTVWFTPGGQGLCGLRAAPSHGHVALTSAEAVSASEAKLSDETAARQAEAAEGIAKAVAEHNASRAAADDAKVAERDANEKADREATLARVRASEAAAAALAASLPADVTISNDDVEAAAHAAGASAGSGAGGGGSDGDAASSSAVGAAAATDAASLGSTPLLRSLIAQTERDGVCVPLSRFLAAGDPVGAYGTPAPHPGSDTDAPGVSVLENKCGGEYCGYTEEQVLLGAQQLAAAIPVAFAGDTDTLGPLLYEGLREKVCDAVKSWHTWHQRQYGAFSHVISFSMHAPETKVPQPQCYNFDVAFRPACAGRHGTWGGHATWRGWWCAAADGKSGVITGLGPVVTHTDAVPIPALEPPAPAADVPSLSWEHQRLALLLRAVRAAALEDRTEVDRVADAKGHGSVYTVEWARKRSATWGDVVGIAADSVQWHAGDAGKDSEASVEVLLVPHMLTGHTAALHRQRVDVSWSPGGNCIALWRTHAPRTVAEGDASRVVVPLPADAAATGGDSGGGGGGGGDLLVSATIRTAASQRVVYAEQKRARLTQIVYVHPGEVAVARFASPVTGHPTTLEVTDEHITVDGSRVRPGATFDAGATLGADAVAGIRCDGSGEMAPVVQHWVRVDNRAGTARAVVAHHVTVLTGRRRLAPRAVAEALPAGSIVPVPQLTPLEAASLLRPDHVLDYDDAAFQGWLDAQGLRRGASEPALAFLERAQAVLQRKIQYAGQKHTIEHARDIAAQPEPLQMHCHGCTLSLLSILRANGVPCRGVAGNTGFHGRPKPAPEPFPEHMPLNMCEFGHTWAEVFVPGLGFLPVEPQSDYSKAGQGALGDDRMSVGGAGFVRRAPVGHFRAVSLLSEAHMDDITRGWDEDEACFLRRLLGQKRTAWRDTPEFCTALAPYALPSRKGAASLFGLNAATQAAIVADSSTGPGWQRRFGVEMRTLEMVLDNHAALGSTPVVSSSEYVEAFPPV